MKQNKAVIGLMLGGTIFTLASPVYAATTTSSSSQTSNQAIVKTTKADSNSQVTTIVSSKVASNNDENDSSNKNDRIQTLTEQTMVIHKVIAKDGTMKATVKSAQSDSSSALGIATDKIQGVNGAKFVIYDLTDLMNEIIKEKLQVANPNLDETKVDKVISEDKTTDTKTVENQTLSEKSSSETSVNNSQSSSAEKRTESSSSLADMDSSSKSGSESESSDNANSVISNEKNNQQAQDLISQIESLRKDDSLRKELATRAAKLDQKQLKEFATVTTATNPDTKEEGVASVKVPLDGKYHAYYVVNTETPKEAHATNSAPIVVLTPVTDEQGLYAESFMVFPKSDTIPEDKPQPEVVTSEKMYQTGHQVMSFWQKVLAFFLGS